MSEASLPPRVSVLMPVYNAGRYLPAAVQSILAQTLADFELLLIDDGSTDDSPLIMDDYAQRDPRVRILRRPNTGLVGALNDGLSHCRGEWIARMDADDVSLENRLELELAYVDAHPDCVAVGGQVLQIDGAGDPLGPFPVALDHETIDAQLLTGRGSALIHPTVMIRREAIQRIGGYCAGCYPSEDLDLFLKLAETGRVANLPEIVLHFRRHESSVTALGKQDAGKQLRMDIVKAAYRRRGWPESEIKLKTFYQASAPADLYYRWAYLAAGAGHDRTCLKYARRMIAAEPWRPRTWTRLARILLRRGVAYLPPSLHQRLHKRNHVETGAGVPLTLAADMNSSQRIR